MSPTAVVYTVYTILGPEESSPCPFAESDVRPPWQHARMAQFLSVREARRTFAQVLNGADYQERRTVILRRGEVAGAFVSAEDLVFLLRYRPSSESGPSKRALDEDRADIAWREQQLDPRGESFRLHGSSEEEQARLAAEREKLAADRRLLDAMATIQTPARDARRAPS